MLLVYYLDPTHHYSLCQATCWGFFSPVGKLYKDQALTSAPVVTSVTPIQDVASSMRWQQPYIVLILFIFSPVMNGISTVTAQNNLLFAPVSALFDGNSYAERLHRGVYFPGTVTSGHSLRGGLASAACLWGKTWGLHGARFKIIATNTSCPLMDIKAKEQLNPRICLSSVMIKDWGFIFKGYNVEVILGRISLFASLWSPTWVEQRTTTPQYCYATQQISLRF